MVNVEDLCPDFFGDVVAFVSAGDDKRLAERELFPSAIFLVPWFPQDFCYTIFQLVKLLSVQS